MDVGGDTAAAAGGSSDIVAFTMVAIIWLAFFSWLTVTSWARQRRREREAYLRNETEKRLLDKDESTAGRILRVRIQDERIRWLQRREGLKLGGLITAAAGIGALVGLRFLDTGAQSVSPMGWIPLGIGLVLLLYAYVLYPKLSELDVQAPSVPPGERGDRTD